jgi:hypothetical protein
MVIGLEVAPVDRYVLPVHIEHGADIDNYLRDPPVLSRMMSLTLPIHRQSTPECSNAYRRWRAELIANGNETFTVTMECRPTGEGGTVLKRGGVAMTAPPLSASQNRPTHVLGGCR